MGGSGCVEGCCRVPRSVRSVCKCERRRRRQAGRVYSARPPIAASGASRRVGRRVSPQNGGVMGRVAQRERERGVGTVGPAGAARNCQCVAVAVRRTTTTTTGSITITITSADGRGPHGAPRGVGRCPRQGAVYGRANVIDQCGKQERKAGRADAGGDG